MLRNDVAINTPIVVPFTTEGLTTGVTTFIPTILLNGAVTNSVIPGFTEIGGGLYTLSFTTTQTGNYIIFIEGQIVANFNVVNRDVFDFLQNLEDEALGSWQWNKQTGQLTLLKQNGSTLGNYTVVDNLTTASREKQ